MFVLFGILFTYRTFVFIVSPIPKWIGVSIIVGIVVCVTVFRLFYNFFTVRLSVSRLKFFFIFLVSFVFAGVSVYIQHTRFTLHTLGEGGIESVDLKEFESIVVTGRVVGKRRGGASELAVYEREKIKLETIETDKINRKDIVRVYILRGDKSIGLRVGDEVVTQGLITRAEPVYTSILFDGEMSLPSVLKGEFDYSVWLRSHGYLGDIRAKSVLVTGTSPRTFRERVRQDIYDRIQSAYSNNDIQALLAGMLYGDISQMSDETYDSFVASSLVHLVAVSGGNVIFVLLVLYALLIRLPVYIRMIAMCIGVIGYVLFVGLDGSLTRAMIMGLLGIGALFVGRSIDVRRALGVARCAYLVMSPYSLVFDVGFLLSFGALTGIVYMSRFMDMIGVSSLMGGVSKTLSRFIQEYLFATIGAFLGVTPVLLFFIGSFNLRGWIANLFVLPLVPIIMCLGSLSLVFESSIYASVSLFDYIGDILVSIVTTCLEYVLHVSDISASAALMLDVTAFHIGYRYIICVGCFLFYLSLYWLGVVYSRSQAQATCNSRVHGFEPRRSASEADVLPLTPHPF